MQILAVGVFFCAGTLAGIYWKLSQILIEMQRKR